MAENKLMTSDEVMEFLRISKPTLLKLMKKGKIKGAKIGRAYRFYEADIKNFVKESIDSSHCPKWD